MPDNRTWGARNQRSLFDTLQPSRLTIVFMIFQCSHMKVGLEGMEGAEKAGEPSCKRARILAEWMESKPVENQKSNLGFIQLEYFQCNPAVRAPT